MPPEGPKTDPRGAKSLAGSLPFSTSIFEGLLGAIFDPSEAHLGPILGRLGPILGSSWAILGPSWGHLGAILGHLGPSWAILGPSGAILGPPWPILGHLGAILGHLGAILGPSWLHLGFRVHSNKNPPSGFRVRGVGGTGRRPEN